METRLMDQHNGKWPTSLVFVSKPLVTVITAIVTATQFDWLCSHEECEWFRAIPVKSRARRFCTSLLEPVSNSNIRYYFRISVAALKIPKVNPWSQKIWIKLTRLWIVLQCHIFWGLMMVFSSSPSQSLILNSGEKIFHVKIVSFSSENSLLKNSCIFICTNLEICPLPSRLISQIFVLHFLNTQHNVFFTI